MTKHYFKNGQIKEEYYVKDGIFDGDCKRWNEEGVLIKHRIYEKGEEVRRIV